MRSHFAGAAARRTRTGAAVLGCAAAITAGAAHAQSITSVTPATAPRAERLVILGSGFGAQQGESEVIVGGVRAHVSRWSDSEIRAHIAEATPLGAAEVRVVGGSGGGGGGGSVTVTERPPRAPGSRLKWKIRTDHFYSFAPPAIGPDGTVYVGGGAGPLYAVAPDGGIRWINRLGGGITPISVGADGTVYFSGSQLLHAASPEGQLLWTFPYPPNAGGIFIGPNVGPDGKIYGVTDERPSIGTDFGAFAVNPDGTLAWSTSGGYTHRASPTGASVAFAGGRVFFATGQGGVSFGSPGVHALEIDDGEEVWVRPGTKDVQSAAGNVNWLGAINNNYIGSYEPDGDERWVVSYNNFLGQPAQYVLAPDGSSVYSTQAGRLAGLRANGSIRWSINPGGFVHPRVATPDSAAFFATAYMYQTDEMFFQLRAAENAAVIWQEPIPFENGVFVSPSGAGAVTPDGRTLYIMGSGNNYVPQPSCYLYAFELQPDPAAACAADFNRSGAANVQDMYDFLQSWSEGSSSANINAVGGVSVQDIYDFVTIWSEGC